MLRPSGCPAAGLVRIPPPPECLTLRYAAYRTTALLLGSQPAPAGMCCMNLNEPWVTALGLFNVGG